MSDDISFEGRMAKVEGTLEQADERLNHVEGELRDSRRDLNHGFS